MFSDLFTDFNDRVMEVDLYFQVLSALDNDEINVKPGIGPQKVPIGDPPGDWGRMLKGASYLILYNLVEAFIRRGFQEVFEEIANDALSGADLTELLRTQWILQKNKKVKPFDGSPKVYMQIANEIVSEIAAKQTVRLDRLLLPFSGNLDDDGIREVCHLHGVSPTTPPAAKGGSALKTVKNKRNSLSHGNESFAECGRLLTASDLVQAKEEIVLYISSILANMEQFATTKGYKKT